MKRVLTIPAVALAFVLGNGMVAQAAETHHATHKCASNCRPAKTPPVGGWPCAKTHSCATKHHYPVCPPIKPPVTPPVTPPPHSKPHKPVLTHTPVKHVVVRTPHSRARLSTATAELPRTGVADAAIYGPAGLALVAGGGILMFAGKKREEAR